jgi:formate hydrogenlyase subunit 3/multisubunit Na+/H+ antiporter MnhD subunit
LTAIAAALVLLVLAGLLSALARPGSRVATRLNSALVALAAIACAASAVGVLVSGEPLALELPWSIPGGALAIGLDPLSAFFLLPVAALSALTACYGVEYLASVPQPARVTWPAFDALIAGMVLVLVARNALLFVTAWEGMSLAAWVLVTGDASSSEGRRAGWIYLVAAHLGSAALLLLFAILAHASGDSGTFDAIRRGGAALPSGWLLLLGLVGFGVKAGVIPLHVWLPEAHAAAPSHVSALMSGAMVKLGFYGMLRLAVLLGPLPTAAGPCLAALGLAGAWLGISLALQQRDLKRALAYSSVENLGLIAIGLGLAAWGSARGNAALALLGLTGALLHVWNHAAMKGLLFLAAGAAIHAAGSRDLERLGGLLRRMPFTGACFVAGAVAISGLPPLNGFNSEWLLYRGLFGAALDGAGVTRVAAFLGSALLSLVGALAAACTVRLVGIAFLGEPRDRAAASAHEPGPWMRAPVALLVLACIALASLPFAVVTLCAPVARDVLGLAVASTDALAATAGALGPIGAFAAASWVTVALGWPVMSLLRGRNAPRNATWGCGFAATSARMQYTARSFSEQFAERVLPRPLAPRARVEPMVSGRFPAPARLATEEGDPITRGGFEPIFSAIASRFARLRVLQQGNAHLYLAYILLAVLASLLWTSLRAQWLP